MKWIIEAESIDDIVLGRYSILDKPLTECKDCTYRNGDYCHRFHDGYSAFIHLDDFCNYAERRTDERFDQQEKGQI